MPLPYENTTAGEKALGEIQKLLRGFGCQQFGSMIDDENQEILVQFKWRDQHVTIKASISGYAQAWLKEHPYNFRMKKTKVEHERKAKQVASIAVYSVLRDWIKGQVTAIETGILSFEGAFLGQLQLPNGNTVLDHVKQSRLLPHSQDEESSDEL